MEGRPWLRILLVLIGFSLLGIPVWSLTRGKPEIKVAEKAPATAGAFRVSLTFAEAPADFTVSYLGKPLFSGHGPEREFSGDWQVGIPKEGADLLLTANWTDGAPQTAVRVVVTQGNDTFADQTVWGQGNIVDTVTVPGKAP